MPRNGSRVRATRPSNSPPTASAAETASSTSRSSRRERSSNASPASVNSTLWVERRGPSHPTNCSRPRICRLRAGFQTYSRSAARPELAPFLGDGHERTQVAQLNAVGCVWEGKDAPGLLHARSIARRHRSGHADRASLCCTIGLSLYTRVVQSGRRDRRRYDTQVWAASRTNHRALAAGRNGVPRARPDRRALTCRFLGGELHRDRPRRRRVQLDRAGGAPVGVRAPRGVRRGP